MELAALILAGIAIAVALWTATSEHGAKKEAQQANRLGEEALQTARRAITVSEESNSIARDALAQNKQANAISERAHRELAEREHSAQLLFRSFRVERDTVLNPKIGFLYRNTGKHAAHDLRWEWFDGSSGDYQAWPESTAPLLVPPDKESGHSDLTIPVVAKGEDGSVVTQGKFTYLDGIGDREVIVRLWSGPVQHHNGGTREVTKVVWATLDGGPHPTLKPDASVAQYASA